MRPDQSSLVETSVKVYRALLWLYPTDYREEYGRHMAQVFRDKAYDVYRNDGDVGIFLYWCAILLDLVLSVIQERREEGFTMSFEFLGKFSKPMLVLSGLLMMLASFSELEPGFWWQRQTEGVYAVANALLIPSLTFLGIGLLGTLINTRKSVPAFGQAGLFVAVLGCFTITIVSITSGTLYVDRLPEDYGWPIFFTGAFVMMLGVIVFGILLIRLGYRWGVLFVAHPGIFLFDWVMSLGKEWVDTPGPHWEAFSLVFTWGLAWIVVAYLLQALQHRQPSSIKTHIKNTSAQEA